MTLYVGEATAVASAPPVFPPFGTPFREPSGVPDPDGEYVAFRARTSAGLGREELAAALAGPGTWVYDTSPAEFDGDLVGFAATALTGLPDAVVGVGPPRRWGRVGESFRSACRAVESACALGLRGVHSVASLGLSSVVVADRDVGEALCHRYLDPLPAGEAVVDTVRAYFASGMRVSRAARRLFLHPNTVRYRLSCFERLTGARLGDVGDAMEVWWALRYAEAVGTGSRPPVARDAEVLRRRVEDEVRARGPEAALLTDPRCAGGLATLVSALARAASGAHELGADEVRLAAVGVAWARRGHPVAELAAVCRSVVRGVVRIRLEPVADRRSEAVQRDVEAAVRRCNALVAVLLGAHGGADRVPAPEQFLRALLLGPRDDTLPRDAVHFGLDPDAAYRAVHGRPEPGGDPRLLARAHGLRVDGGSADGMAAVVGSEVIGFVPAGVEPAAGAGTGVLGLGPARPIHRVAESFRMATRALDTAVRLGRTGVQDFTGLGSLPALWAADHAVHTALTGKYLAPLGQGEQAARIADTVYAYLLAGRNVQRAARRLVVHPNTVHHRVGRFERLVGVDLRAATPEVFEVLWTLRRRRADWADIPG
ncbi:helix-turn-helix domain-containing protein [Saccharothrix sp. NPDC042600]|uniref:PucR family transcriptional regulator n=1 Tax=Saccharothrix TaxID=2071 RepID=UPI0033D99EA4|nr:hypothetical protein GCM10017745_58130 [Saccharothrix mutabilis subsp. capreolus]